MPRLAAVESSNLLRNYRWRAPPQTIETICGYTIWEGRTKALIDSQIQTSFFPSRCPLWTPPPSIRDRLRKKRCFSERKPLLLLNSCPGGDDGRRRESVGRCRLPQGACQPPRHWGGG